MPTMDTPDRPAGRRRAARAEEMVDSPLDKIVL